MISAKMSRVTPAVSTTTSFVVIEPIVPIVKVIGKFGKWQLQAVILVFFCKIPAAWFMACILFTAPFAKEDEYICRLDGMVISNETIDQIHPMKPDGQYDRCNIYKNITNHKNSPIIPCGKWAHYSQYPNTLVTMFDLVCSRKILIAVTQFFYFLGVLAGGILANLLMDGFSPKNVMFGGMITQIFFGCGTGLIYDFNWHPFLRFLTAISCALMYTSGQVLISEITGGAYRKAVHCLFESFWGIGIMLLPLIAHLFPAWTSIFYAISLPTLVYIFLWYWIPDSPLWLLRHGQSEAAKILILEAVKTNDRFIHLPVHFDNFLKSKMSTQLKLSALDNWLSLWYNSKTMFMLIALHTAWAVDVTNYNGMLLNIRAFGRNYLIVNTIVSGLSIITGVLIAWFIIMKLDKNKFVYSGCFNIIAGCLSCLRYLIAKESSGSQIVVIFNMMIAMISIISTTVSQAVLFTCTTEVVPKPQRHICFFSCVVCARIWLLTAPFIGTIQSVNHLFPLAAFGFMELVGGICSIIVNCLQHSPEISNYE